MNRLTQAQKEAINYRDNNILVAASAGTGKTFAMITRVLELIMGRSIDISEGKEKDIEDKDNRVSASNILLMTYTIAAAAEMRERLSNALIEELNKTIDSEKREYLLEQIDSLPRCNISTIHSFCAEILRSYFQYIDINPLFDIADEQDERAYITEALLQTFDEYDNSEQLKRMRRIFSTKLKDNKLERLIVDIYKYAYCQEDMDKWLDEISISQYSKDINSTYSCEQFIKGVRNSANELTNKMIEARNYGQENNYPELILWAEKCAEIIAPYIGIKNIDDYFNASEVNPIIPIIEDKKGLVRAIKGYRKAVNEFLSTYSLYLKGTSREEFLSEIKEVGALVKDAIDLVKSFAQHFSSIKHKENKLTFQDLEVLTAKLLSIDDIKRDIESRYKYILVDEYQDINYLQEYIVSRLSSGNNLFMVGDSKQSIYRFRQAVPEIFLNKEKRFEKTGEGKNIAFNHNFRSRKAILDYVNKVFSSLMTEQSCGMNYSSYAMLIADPDDDSKYSEANDYPAVSILTYYLDKKRTESAISDDVYSVMKDETEDEDNAKGIIEADIIRLEIDKLIGKQYYDKKANQNRIIRYEDIVILFKSRNPKAQAIINRLVEYNIPLNTSTFNKEENTNEINLLINLLRVIDNYKQDIPLCALMRSYFGRFTDEELVQIRLMDQNRETHLHDLLLKIDDPKIRPKIEKFLELIRKYRLKSHYMPVYELLNDIISDSGYDLYILAHSDGDKMYNNLKAFLDSIKDKSFASSISRFLYYHDNYFTAVNNPAVAESETNCISVSTMHGVKGLEYPIVIIANADARQNNSNLDYLMDNELGLCFMYYNADKREKDNNIIYQAFKDRAAHKERIDHLNLYYVAMTRAKNHLIIIGHDWKDGLKPVEKPDDVKNLLKCAVMGSDLCYCNRVDVSIENVLPEEKKDLIAYYEQDEESIYYNELVKAINYQYINKESLNIGIKHSVSAINKSDDYEDIYIPSLYEEDSAFKGTLSHKVMESINFNACTYEQVLEELDRLKDEGYITAEERNSIDIDEIVKCMNSPIIRYANKNSVMREKAFMLKIKAREIFDTTAEDEILLQGAIDLIILGQSTTIVDYKRTSVIDDNVIRARYSKQLELYKMAVEKILNIKVDKLIIYLFGQNREIEV